MKQCNTCHNIDICDTLPSGYGSLYYKGKTGKCLNYNKNKLAMTYDMLDNLKDYVHELAEILTKTGLEKAQQKTSLAHIDLNQLSPKYLEIYSSKDHSHIKTNNHCYIVVFTRSHLFGYSKGIVYYVNCNDNPKSGDYQYSTMTKKLFTNLGGARIQWKDISKNLRRTILEHYEQLWGIIFTYDKDYFVTSFKGKL